MVMVLAPKKKGVPPKAKPKAAKEAKEPKEPKAKKEAAAKPAAATWRSPRVQVMSEASSARMAGRPASG
jgi:predicted NAD-dependent protein-ADP-ribosyltransferase YbiA (DUF1768 family)